MPRRQVAGGRGCCPQNKHGASSLSWERNPLPSATESGRAAGHGARSRVGARRERRPPQAGLPRASGRPGPASGSGQKVAPALGPFSPGPTHRRCVWFSAVSWGCVEEAAETRSGAPPPGHHTPRASRPGPRPPPPGAVPAPVPRGEPPQPPARSAARPLAAASAQRAPALASRCRPGPPPGPSLRSRCCRQTRRAESRAAGPAPRELFTRPAP